MKKKYICLTVSFCYTAEINKCKSTIPQKKFLMKIIPFITA